MKYIEQQDGKEPWKFHGEYKRFKYAARVFVQHHTRTAIIDSFCKLHNGYDTTKWSYHWGNTKYPGQYEMVFYTHDLDWQVMNRLYGDILPNLICTICVNREIP
jgi:hypothetical protein